MADENKIFPNLRASSDDPVGGYYKYPVADLISGKDNSMWDYLTPEQQRVVTILRNNQDLTTDTDLFSTIPQYFRNKKADALFQQLSDDAPLNRFVPDPDATNGDRGYYDLNKDKIFIRHDLKGTQRAGTTIHEIAHWLQGKRCANVQDELDADSTASLIIKRNPSYKRDPKYIKEKYEKNGYDIPYRPEECSY